MGISFQLKLSTILIFLVLTIPTIIAPEITFLFRDQQGNQIRATIDYEQRPDGRLNIFINFNDPEYLLDEINIMGLIPVIQPININLGKYQIIPENESYLISEFDTHLIGLNQNLDFEEATIKLKKRHPQKIEYLFECNNWNTNTFNCDGDWINSLVQFTQDENSITFTTNHFSGWAGSSWMYDDFETQGANDYCISSNATASGWTGSVCNSGSGTFKVGSFTDNYMDNQTGNLTAGGSGTQTYVYKDIGVALENSFNQRVYIKEDCNNQINVPSGRIWNVVSMTNGTQGTTFTSISFDENESLTCGGLINNVAFTCSGNIPQQINCGQWYYIELYTESSDDNLTCYLNGETFCSEEKARAFPVMRYLALGKGVSTYSSVTGTLFFDEYRAVATGYIGGYPNISNLKEKADPIEPSISQQLNATIVDLDNDLNNVWITINNTNYFITNHVGDEYYFIYSSGNYSANDTIDYSWYANDSNGQVINKLGSFDVTTSVNNETQARQAILEGINNIISNSTKTYDQQIYISYLNGTQDKGYFDIFVLYNQQRWTFNYLTGNETLENMTSLRTTINILEMQGLTYNGIVSQVENFINSTLE